MTNSIINAQKFWSAYVDAIGRYIAGETGGCPHVDAIMRAVLEENLQCVHSALQRLDPPGVVAKIKLLEKAGTAPLWREWDARLRQHAALRQPGARPLSLPMRATKDAFRRYDAEAMLQAAGRYQHTRNADLHHIWPETLGGPSTGWNLVPLPPIQHHDILHPIIDQIVRKSLDGQRFRLT